MPQTRENHLYYKNNDQARMLVEVIHIKPQILLRTEVCKECLIGTRATGCIIQKLRLHMQFFVRAEQRVEQNGLMGSWAVSLRLSQP
jgi:hypothetical protein